MAGYDPNQPRDADGRWTSEGKSYNSEKNKWIIERRDAAGNKVGIDAVAASERDANRIMKAYERERKGWIDPAEAAAKAARQAAGIEPYDRSFIEYNLFADDIEKNKDGTFTVRRTFYYKMGGDEYQWRDKVMESLPMAEIVGFGEIEEPFKGGALPKNQSHWWAKIRFPGK